MESQATLHRGPSSIELRFVRGFHEWSIFPEEASEAGLWTRFAVIQDTYVEGCVDMYFDELLWRRLAAFAREWTGGGPISVRRDDGTLASLAEFEAEFDAAPAEDRSPPAVLFVDLGRCKLCIAHEAWHTIGGPRPYADSHTYSVYTDRDIGDELVGFLRRSPGDERWTFRAPIDASVEPVKPTPHLRRGFFDPLFGR